MERETDAIRREIDETRGDMSDTVEALSGKADIKGRAKGALAERRDAVKERVGMATPSKGEMRDGARQAAGIAQENPLGLAVGAVAAGFLAGTLVPSTTVEDERVGPMSDEVKERAKEAGQETLERGKEAAREAAETTASQAQESAQRHASEVGG
jgi:ElaB/YqjD/DUF883 family membrane-anchored ribosome-binding protein